MRIANVSNQFLSSHEIPEELTAEFKNMLELLPPFSDNHFEEVAKKVANGGDTIVLVVADEGYLHLYQNFLETSIIKYDLPALSVALDESSYV